MVVAGGGATGAYDLAQSLDCCTRRSQADMTTNFQAGCRLVMVPMPFAYVQVVKATITLYVTVSPFAFVADLKWSTPAAAFVLAMIIYSLDESAPPPSSRRRLAAAAAAADASCVCALREARMYVI